MLQTHAFLIIVFGILVPHSFAQQADKTWNVDPWKSCTIPPSLVGSCAAPSRPLKVAVVSSSVPRRCGIAVFSNDLVTALREVMPPLTEIDVIAVSDQSLLSGPYPPWVVFSIREQIRDDYVAAARFVTTVGYNVLVIQHEFGIFGGSAGEHILLLMTSVRCPVVVTLHTVLRRFEMGERLVMHAIARRANVIVTLAENGCDLLRNSSLFSTASTICRHIPHGVADVTTRPREQCKKSLGLEGLKVITTFGLLHEGKGIEYVIDALPNIVDRHPQVKYLILGETHPHVRMATGRDYKEILQARAEKQGVAGHLHFDSSFISFTKLLDYLCATDIYVTPYLGLDQISSGTLTLAMAAGTAVVSTPYIYASWMLAEHRGVLVTVRDSASIAHELSSLFSRPRTLARLSCNAYLFTRKFVWPAVASSYACEFYHLVNATKPLVPEPINAALPASHPFSHYLTYVQSRMQAQKFRAEHVLALGDSIPASWDAFNTLSSSFTDILRLSSTSLLFRDSGGVSLTALYYEGSQFLLGNSYVTVYGDLSKARVYLSSSTPRSYLGHHTVLISGQFARFTLDGRFYEYRVGVSSLNVTFAQAKDRSNAWIEFVEPLYAADIPNPADRSGKGTLVAEVQCTISLKNKDLAARFSMQLSAVPPYHLEDASLITAYDGLSTLRRDLQFDRYHLSHSDPDSDPPVAQLRPSADAEVLYEPHAAHTHKSHPDPRVKGIAVIQRSSAPSAVFTEFEHPDSLELIRNHPHPKGHFHWLEFRYSLGPVRPGRPVIVSERRWVVARIIVPLISEYMKTFGSWDKLGRPNVAAPEDLGRILLGTSLFASFLHRLQDEKGTEGGRQQLEAAMKESKFWLDLHIHRFCSIDVTSSFHEAFHALTALERFLAVTERASCEWKARLQHVTAHLYSYLRHNRDQGTAGFRCAHGDVPVSLECTALGLLALAKVSKHVRITKNFQTVAAIIHHLPRMAAVQSIANMTHTPLSTTSPSFRSGHTTAITGAAAGPNPPSSSSTSTAQSPPSLYSSQTSPRGSSSLSIHTVPTTDKLGLRQSLTEGNSGSYVASALYLATKEVRDLLMMDIFKTEPTVHETVHAVQIATSRYLIGCLRHTDRGPFVASHHSENTVDLSQQWLVLSAISDVLKQHH